MLVKTTPVEKDTPAEKAKPRANRPKVTLPDDEAMLPAQPRTGRANGKKDSEPQAEAEAPKQSLRISNPFSGMGETRRVAIRKLLGLAVIMFSIFLLVAIVSHFFAGREDQSVVEFGAFPTGPLPEKPQNTNGTLGAWLANLFVTQGYGFVALLLPPYFFMLGYAILEDTQWPLLRSLTVYTFLATHWVAFCFGFITHLFGLHSLDWAGGVGLSLTDWTARFIGLPGTGLAVLLLLVGFVVVRFNTRTDFLSFIPSFGSVHNAHSGGPQTNIPEVDESGMQADQIQPIVDAMEDDEDVLEGNFIVNVRKVKGVAPETEGANPAMEGELLTLVLPDTAGKASHKKGVVGDGEVSFEIAETQTAIEPESTDNLVPLAGDVHLKATASEDQETLDDEEVVADWEAYDPMRELAHYKFPTLELLRQHETPGGAEVSRAELEENKNRIVTTLRNYNIEITSIKATVGPTITLYEIVPAAGVRISKIKGLEDDIALSLAALGIRIIAPMPGKGTIGIEIPNSRPEIVSFRSLVATEKFRDTKAELPLAIGKTISNEVFVADLTKMPHLLVAGATQQGKSVGLNCIIASLLYKKHPSQLKFVLIDPKKVELTLFHLIEKHYLAKLPNYEDSVITDNKQVIHVLTSLCMEMDNRYQLLKTARVRNVAEYNAKFVSRKLNPHKGHRYLPYIVLIIDELADLMMTAGKEVETPICRLAQLARATGIHLVIATQRPSVNVITGIIKANFPARMSYRVTSKVDSRTILDTNGADQLIGRGDLLLSQGTDLLRIQNAFIDTNEIESLVQFINNQTGPPLPYFLPEVLDENADDDDDGELDNGEIDSLYDEAARLVVRTQSGSTSLIQRKMSIGYNRAGRIMDQLERTGIVGAASGSKPRDVLVRDEAELDRILVTLRKPE